MSNQTSTFDKSFVSARIDDCILICSFQVNNGFPNSTLFQQSYEQGISWITNFGHKSGLLPHDLQDAQDHLNSLYDTFISYCCEKVNSTLDSSIQVQPHHESQPSQVSESTASVELPVLRVLGQVSKAATEREKRGLSLLWFPTLVRFPGATKFLSNTRPVGGLA